MTNEAPERLPCLKLAWLGVCVTSRAEDEVWRASPKDAEDRVGYLERTGWHPLFREYKAALVGLQAAIKNTYGKDAYLHMPYAISKHEVFIITKGDFGMAPASTIAPENVLAELSTVEPI